MLKRALTRHALPSSLPFWISQASCPLFPINNPCLRTRIPGPRLLQLLRCTPASPMICQLKTSVMGSQISLRAAPPLPRCLLALPCHVCPAMAMPGKEAIPNACPNQSSSPVPYFPIQCICRSRAITPRCLIQIYTNEMMGRPLQT